MAEVKWKDVAKHCEVEIARAHRLLETIQPEAATNQLRGEIRALRRVLDLGRDPAPLDPSKMLQPQKPEY